MTNILVTVGQVYKKFYDGILDTSTLIINRAINPLASNVLLGISYLISAPIFVLDKVSSVLKMMHSKVENIIILSQLLAFTNNVVLKTAELVRAVIGLPFSVLRAFLVFDVKTSLDASIYNRKNQYIPLFENMPSFLKMINYGHNYFQIYLHVLATYFSQGLLAIAGIIKTYLYVPIITHIVAINTFLFSSLTFSKENSKESENIYWQLPLALFLLPVVFVLKVIAYAIRTVAMIVANGSSEYFSELPFNLISVMNPFDLLGMNGVMTAEENQTVDKAQNMHAIVFNGECLSESQLKVLGIESNFLGLNKYKDQDLYNVSDWYYRLNSQDQEKAINKLYAFDGIKNNLPQITSTWVDLQLKIDSGCASAAEAALYSEYHYVGQIVARLLTFSYNQNMQLGFTQSFHFTGFKEGIRVVASVLRLAHHAQFVPNTLEKLHWAEALGKFTECEIEFNKMKESVNVKLPYKAAYGLFSSHDSASTVIDLLLNPQDTSSDSEQYFRKANSGHDHYDDDQNPLLDSKVCDY